MSINTFRISFLTIVTNEKNINLIQQLQAICCIILSRLTRFIHHVAWIISSISSMSLVTGQCQPHFSSSFDFAMWRHLSIFQISHFGANDPFEGGNFYNMAILPFPSWLSMDSLPCRRSKFNWKAAFQVIPQLYNYTGDACLHVAPFAPIYCTFCTV